MSNTIILEGCIDKFSSFNEIEAKSSEVFELFSISQIFKDRDLSYDDIIESIVDGGQDGGVDSILIFINGELISHMDDIDNIAFNNKTHTEFVFIQCKKEKSFKESSLDKLIVTMPELLDLEKNETSFLTRFNPNLVNKILLLIQIWKKTAIDGGNLSSKIFYVTNANTVELGGAFNEKSEQLRKIISSVLSTQDVRINCISSKELLQLYTKQKTNRLSIEFKDRPLTVEFGDGGIGYIGTVKLGAYKKFLTSDSNEIMEDLFESNIRHFQGNTVDVNKKIRASIKGQTLNEDFWWLNNGITIIAEDPKEVGKKLSIENIQIVNGLQTSYSIFHHHLGTFEDERSVLVKVIINNDKKIVDNIIASTNSQNPVSTTLLRATEDFQRNLELYFLNEGYFYDRRKNFYKNQGKPANRIFSIQVVAQAIEAILFSNPNGARSSPTTLVKTEAEYNRIFDEKKNFQIYLNCSLIHNKVHAHWLGISDNKLKNKLANFKLHLAFLYPIFLLKQATIGEKELIKINPNNFDSYVFKQQVDFLNNQITDYLNKYPEKNLINIAKEKGFTTFLKEKISDEFIVI